MIVSTRPERKETQTRTNPTHWKRTLASGVFGICVTAAGIFALGAAEVPWHGQPAKVETVDQIMARDAQNPTVDTNPGAGHRHHQSDDASPPRLRHNPDAPLAAQWPVSGGSGLDIPLIPGNLGANFLGAQSSESSDIPPDSMGAVGLSQVLVIVNGRIKIFGKTGALGGLNTTTDNFFSSVRSAGSSDPHVRFDRLSQRWFITMVDIANVNRVLIAVSSGPTVTGSSSFYFYQFQHDQVGDTPNSDTGGFCDYDMLGVDKFALYIGANIFSAISGGSILGSTGFVVNKSDLLSGTLTVTPFRQLGAVNGGTGIWSPQGVDNDDPDATEGYFVGSDRVQSGTLHIRRVSDPGGTPSISGDLTVTVPATSTPIGQAHKGDTLNKKLAPVDARLFAAALHKNKIDGTTSLWTAHNIQVNSGGVASSSGGRNGSRWYQIGNLTTTPALVQSGTLYDSATSNPRGYWMPSVASSGQGHMALGCSYAGTNDFAGIAVAVRLRTDALGSIQSPTQAVVSTTAYNLSGETTSTHRWGDYSQTVVDPTDDMTLWTFQEYCNSASSWGVRAIQIRAALPAYAISCVPNSLTAGQTNVDVMVTAASNNGSEFFDPGPDTDGPGFPNHIHAFISSDITINSITFVGPTNLILNVSVSTNALAGGHFVQVTNPDNQRTNGAANTLTILAPPVVTVPPANRAVGQGLNSTFALTVAGTSPLSYQWRYNSMQIPGATNSTYTLTNAQCTDAGGYDVVVTNYLGGTTSGVAMLTVDGAAVISSQPTNQIILLGQAAAFAVSASNQCGGGLNYQWQQGGTNISGATNSMYSIGTAQMSDAGSYAVVVSTLAGAVTSSIASLTVIGPPTVDFTAAPLSGPAPLTVNFTNLTTGASSYLWTFGDGGSSSSMNPTNTYAGTGSYTVALVAVGPGGTNSMSKTNFITVTSQAPPLIVLGPQNATNFIFSFATTSGKTYAVEYKQLLTDPVWQTLTSMPGDGTVHTVSDPLASSQRFYRLNVQ